MNRWTAIFALFIFTHHIGGQSFETFFPKQKKSYASASFSVEVVDLTTQKSLLSYDANRILTPASLLKLVTTSSALEILGESFRYKSYLKATPTSSEIYQLSVIAANDPTFGSSQFTATPSDILKRWSQSLQSKGIQTVSESIKTVNPQFAFSPTPSSRLWEDMCNYYGAGVYPFSYRDNMYTLYLNSFQTGTACQFLRTEPQVEYPFQIKAVASVNNRDSAYIYNLMGTTGMVVEGSIPANKKEFAIKGTLLNPAAQFNQEFLTQLKHDNIVISNSKDIAIQQEKELLIDSIISPSLGDIITITNKKSNNLFADHLFISCGQKLNETNDWNRVGKKIEAYWKTKLGIETVYIKDGSGLSPKNGISATFMCRLLYYMNQSENNELFRHSLSKSGIDGTLRNYFTQTPNVGKLIGKTGSFERVYGVSGYLTCQSGKELAVSIIINQFEGEISTVRKDVEQFMKQLIATY